jgi:transcriptional regulator with XRE-family HTH domain
MARTVPFRRTIDEERKEPAFAREYDVELQRLQIAEQIARARQSAGLTQAGLAQRMGTSQPTVARLERGEYAGSYTVATLARAAHALGHRLRVELEPVQSVAETGAKKVASRSAGKKRQ